MAAIMQAFYWDCPKVEGREALWWPHVRNQLNRLASLGIDMIWLPPAQKSFAWDHMGYDPYDYYDLGEFDQKGRKETWFGSRAELGLLIAEAHRLGIRVMADLVLNHNSGGALEDNPIQSQIEGKECKTWTSFQPASGLFPRNYEHFHPSLYSPGDRGKWGEMPDLCHLHPDVYRELMRYAAWLVEFGFDAFRYDCVKYYNAWMVFAIQSYLERFGVGEYWDDEHHIEKWLEDVDYRCSAFDFPLRENLAKLCREKEFPLAQLRSGLVERSPFRAVTFVENHDTERTNPLHARKMLAYSYILTHEGYPCVFWKDFYVDALAREGEPHGIAALLKIGREYARGQTQELYRDDSLYVMRRMGKGSPGLVYLLNQSPAWRCFCLSSEHPLTCGAWGEDPKLRPDEPKVEGSGEFRVRVPPSGYAVYVPKKVEKIKAASPTPEKPKGNCIPEKTKK